MQLCHYLFECFQRKKMVSLFGIVGSLLVWMDSVSRSSSPMWSDVGALGHSWLLQYLGMMELRSKSDGWFSALRNDHHPSSCHWLMIMQAEVVNWSLLGCMGYFSNHPGSWKRQQLRNTRLASICHFSWRFLGMWKILFSVAAWLQKELHDWGRSLQITRYQISGQSQHPVWHGDGKWSNFITFTLNGFNISCETFQMHQIHF